MKTFISLLVALSLISSNVFAQQPKTLPVESILSPEPEEDLKPRISPMRTDDIAPFSGILFSPRATATIITELETVNQKIAIEVNKAVKDATAKKQFEIDEINSKCITSKSTLQATINANEKRIMQLRKDLKDAQDIANNSPSRLLWASLGVGTGVALTILITFAVNQSTK